MPEIQLQTILNNGEVPTLNPVANFAALNSLTTDSLLIGATCVTIDTNDEYLWTGLGGGWILKENSGDLIWNSITTGVGSGWNSNAEVAKIPGTNSVLMRGNFVSTFQNNKNTIGIFPSGFEPESFGYRQILMKQPPAQEFITSGIVEWSGGGQTLIINPIDRVAPGDLVLATVSNPGTEFNYVVSATVTANITIEFTLTHANTSNDVSIVYLVVRESDYKNVQLQYRAATPAPESQPAGLAFLSTVGSTEMKANIDNVVYVDGLVYSTAS